MQFKDLKPNDSVFVFHSNQSFDKEVIKDVNSHGGFISLTLVDSDLRLHVEAEKSIYFDESNDVVIFMKKHDLIKDL